MAAKRGAVLAAAVVVFSATLRTCAALEVTAASPVFGTLGNAVSILCEPDEWSYPETCSFTR